MCVDKRVAKLWFMFLFVLLLLSLYGSREISARSFESEAVQSDFKELTQVSEGTVNVTVRVFLAGNYELIDLNIRNRVDVTITVSLTEAQATTHVISAVPSFSLTEVADLPDGAYYTYGFWGYPPRGILRVYLPANLSHASFKLGGYLPETGFLWRNTAEVHFLNVTSNLQVDVPYRLVLTFPSSSRVLRAYSYAYPNLAFQEEITAEGKSIIVSQVHPKSPIVTLYEPQMWEIYALVLLLMTLILVYMTPYVLAKLRRGRQGLGAYAPRFITRLQKSLLSKLSAILRRLYNKILSLKSSKLLKLYVLCALLMISVSFAFGPDPRLKVYILASTPGNAKEISEFVSRQVGAYPITVYDEMNEFKTLTNLGIFSAVIVGDFYPPSAHTLKQYIYPALDLSPRIIVVNEYAYTVFTEELQRRYSDTTQIVGRLSDLISPLYRLPRKTNALGLNVDFATYEVASALVGVFSFIIVFLGMAFLASRLIEAGKKPGVGGYAEAIIYSIVIFLFNQILYIVSSVLLAMPLGLHASSSKVTVIGFLGLGGGSRLRTLAGLAGFLLGSFLSIKEGPKLDKAGFVAFFIAGFFILIDPLTSGIIFYEFVLLFTIGPGMEYAYTTWSYVRAFFASIAAPLGAWVSPVYEISTGIILYYAGTVLFSIFAKLKRTTSTMLLLFSAFCISQGGIRISDMNPWKAFASVIPGIATAFFFIAIFYVLNLIETVVRAKISKV